MHISLGRMILFKSILNQLPEKYSSAGYVVIFILLMYLKTYYDLFDEAKRSLDVQFVTYN